MGCPPRVRGALESVDGVTVKDLDFASKTVTVNAKSDTDTKALIAALEVAGFGGEVK